MASIRRLWLNALFLLLTQGEKCCGSISTKATGSTITTTSSVVLSNQSTTAAIHSTVSLISTSVTERTPINQSAASTVLRTSTYQSTASIVLRTSTHQSTASTVLRTSTHQSTASTVLRTSTYQSTASTDVILQSAASPRNMVNSSDALHAFISSTVSSTVVSGDTGKDGDSEPKKNLYVWQLVAIGCGAFVLVPFIIIGLLCYQNRVLRKKLNASRSYSLPIKDNGAWIDSQDIPLWQKRASAFVSENPTAEPEGAPTLTT